MRANHWDAMPATLYLPTEEPHLVRSVRAMSASQQATSMRIPSGAGPGRDLLSTRTAEDNGFTWLAGRSRCKETAPLMTHASVPRAFVDQQLLIDFNVCNLEGTARACRHFQLVHATGRARRALAVRRAEEERS